MRIEKRNKFSLLASINYLLKHDNLNLLITLIYTQIRIFISFSI